MRICERCGQGDRVSKSAWVRDARTGKRVRGCVSVLTGVSMRSLTLGCLCDACWERERVRLDALCEKRANACHARVHHAIAVGVLALTGYECERDRDGAFGPVVGERMWATYA
jgi:hypothetical protein